MIENELNSRLKEIPRIHIYLRINPNDNVILKITLFTLEPDYYRHYIAHWNSTKKLFILRSIRFINK